MKEHIVSTYDDDLNTLKRKLLEMGVLVERQIFQAIEVTKIINLSKAKEIQKGDDCLLYTSPSPRDATLSRMPSSA